MVGVGDAMACASTLGRAVGGRGCAGGFLDGDVGRATQAGGGAVACSSGAGSGGRAQKKVQKCALRRLQSERVGLGWSNADSEHSTLSSSSHGGVARRRERRADGCAALIGGLSGSFWDGADDSAANEHVASRKGSYTKVWWFFPAALNSEKPVTDFACAWVVPREEFGTCVVILCGL